MFYVCLHYIELMNIAISGGVSFCAICDVCAEEFCVRVASALALAVNCNCAQFLLSSLSTLLLYSTTTIEDYS